MTETSNTITCSPGHAAGSKPYIVPVVGTGGCVVVHHGHDYLDGEGEVTRTPVHFHRPGCEYIGRSFLDDPGIVGGYAAARAAIEHHAAAVSS